MKIIRNGVFETNSSSTHSLIMKGHVDEDYLPVRKKMYIEFIQAGGYAEGGTFYSLKEKVSYLVSHLIDKYKWECANYEELKEEVENDWNYIRLKDYVQENFGIEILLPNTYKGDLEEIVSINHQLVERDFNDMLVDIVRGNNDILNIVLASDSKIVIGND